MEITAHGESYTEPDFTKVKFRCPNCKCKFNLTQREYAGRDSVRCPECGKKAKKLDD